MTAVLQARIDEDLALIVEMLTLVPAGVEEWRPPWPGAPAFTVKELAAHLVESCGGVCACFARLHPSLGWERREAELWSVDECRARLRLAFAATRDEDLMRVISTYFVPEGEPFLAVLLINLKHVNHHAHQLFVYLKLLGVRVETRHLYRFK